MTSADRYKIIIVGAGPAGLATALWLAKIAPDLAAHTLVLEAKTHPRPKLCGGGVTFHGEQQLERLGIEVDVPAVYIHQLDFKLHNRTMRVPCTNAMRIIERADFDAALARKAVEQGIRLHTGERLHDLRVRGDGVEVVTNCGTYFADAVVGADGANSTVRRKLRLFNTVSVARLLRVLTPMENTPPQDASGYTAVFDFSCIAQGIQGYIWDFPSVVGGRQMMNRGVFDSRIAPLSPERDNLKDVFLGSLSGRGVRTDDVPLKGHPVRWFDPKGEFARPRVLLAGDAAGVDSLFAEGISYGLEFGEIAAHTLQQAFAQRDFQFEGYKRDLLGHTLGRSLARRTAVAKQLYHYRAPWLWSFFWQMSAISPLVVKRGVGRWLDVLP